VASPNLSIDQVSSAPSDAPPAGAGRRFARLRAFARARRRWGAALLAVPVLLVVALDASKRGDRLLGFSGKYLASYAVAMLESGLLWGLLLFAASARKGPFRWLTGALFVVLATMSLGGQVYFYKSYSVYLNLDATLFGTSVGESVFGQLKADGKNFLLSTAPPFLLAGVLVWLGRIVLRPRRTRMTLPLQLASLVAVVSVFLIPCSYRTVQGSTPDVIYFHAVGGLVKSLSGVRTQAQVRPGLRTPPKLPALTPKPATGRPRNVLFVLTESVRADAACAAHEDSCPPTPEVNALMPDRIPLREMRSNTSTTAIELSVLWSGLLPTEPREALHTAPLLFDFAHAAGFDTAYLSSHHMLFANSRLYVQDLPTSHQTGATDLDPLADIDTGARDDLLTARAKHDLGEMKEPFFAVVHYGNTHLPYRVDPADSPFQPSLASKAEADNAAYKNYYLNAVHLQDKTIADLLRWVRSQPMGDRTVVVFTSDHGEQFREHQQYGHTCSVFEEEMHVPFWVDAPKGVLTPAEEQALRALESAPLFHLDVAPTILDLLGLDGAPELASWRAKMPGASLVRPNHPEPKAVPLTNCSEIWGCAFKNWGMMRGFKKLAAREWERDWQCYDVHDDPHEQHDLGAAACGDLPALANALYGGLPSAP
jgi:glucan phosphoethanolaminetransferase (alkaline phosphatase superfamily)